MKLLKVNAMGDAVSLLQELLNELGYGLVVNGFFDETTEAAVRDYQNSSNLVSDGIVYTKTWTRLIDDVPSGLGNIDQKFLKESDIVGLAERLGLPVATIKAVNEVESSGRGFNLDGNPKILFEGHVFWKQLQQAGIDPTQYVRGNEDVLYKAWTKQHYQGGKGEHDRLNKAIILAGNNTKMVEAAYCSASWGLFQIMGFHYESLGYGSVTEFVAAMQLDEGKHLAAFGKFMEVNGLVPLLKERNWAGFARRYNGSGYAANAYDTKLEAAYRKHAASARPTSATITEPHTTVLRKGSAGPLVRELQSLLNELDYPVSVTGTFDLQTHKAVRAFQSNHLDKHNQPLSIDGVVGALSWWALLNPRPKVEGSAIDYAKLPPVEPGESGLGRKALAFAINEMKAGAGESGGNNRGPWVKKYLDPGRGVEGNSWCAAFVSWCYLQALEGQAHQMPFAYSIGARDIYNQMRSKGWNYDGTGARQPKPGDIVCWWRESPSSWKGHIGLVHHCKDGFLYTIEGNRAANVAGFSYVKARMDKLLGYARILEVNNGS